MEQRDGYVKRVTFRSPESGYTVLTLEVKGTGEELTCVGTFPVIDEGENIRVSGEFTNHTVYGRQLNVWEFETIIPAAEDEMIRYLGSGAIKGIGLATAVKIVDRFHEDAFYVIEKQPERLADISGISAKKAQEIHDRFVEKQNIRNTVMYLQQYGISLPLALRIIERYGEDTVAILQTNPYRIAEDIPRVGFMTADAIASRMGGFEDSDFRNCACMLYVLHNALSFGHSCFPEKSLFTHMQDYVENLDEDAFDLILRNAVANGKVRTVTEVDEEGRETRYVYRSMCYSVEKTIARMLADIDEGYKGDPDLTEELLAEALFEGKESLDETQQEAVREAVCHGVFVLTGGPGTGKTTTINAILRVLAKQQRSCVLAAPTGRAAKRMAEATGREAMTIHRLLECRRIPGDSIREDGRGEFARDASNPLEADAVIIDEASMVDMFLMNSLLKAISPGMTTLILVGDANQLPSVGPGNVLRDIIGSDVFASVCLTRIFRQEEASDIVLNAHRINRGEMPVMDNKSRDFFFLARKNARDIRANLPKLVKEQLPKYVDASPYDIQVLTPMRKGDLGVESLNRLLQDTLNPPSRDKAEWVIDATLTFREGDKVIQTKNNYMLERTEINEDGISTDNADSGVFNGDIGVIESLSAEYRTMIVLFDRRYRVVYADKEVDDLELAYALTIHKSQGSEYPAVVMPLLSGPRALMSRNLLYTGVTRAIRCATILGDAETIRQMVENNEEFKRYTGLCRCIREQKTMP
ncbi:MAG: ATP-dependent RecD-like DNA helicase [Lachnospiraceae bacterium]|nr:ATP-dependent RecD-like DNA helicase [Lachnospiraceae bacterium]